MIDRFQQIYSTVTQAVADVSNINITDKSTDTPTKFPTISVTRMDSPDDPRSLKLSGFGDTAIKCYIEIRTYTKNSIPTKVGNVMASPQDKLERGFEIQTLACDAMKSLGFSKTFGVVEIENIADTDVCVLISRHFREIGAGDNLEWS